MPWLIMLSCGPTLLFGKNLVLKTQLRKENTAALKFFVYLFVCLLLILRICDLAEHSGKGCFSILCLFYSQLELSL